VIYSKRRPKTRAKAGNATAGLAGMESTTWMDSTKRHESFEQASTHGTCIGRASTQPCPVSLNAKLKISQVYGNFDCCLFSIQLSLLFFAFAKLFNSRITFFLRVNFASFPHCYDPDCCETFCFANRKNLSLENAHKRTREHLWAASSECTCSAQGVAVSGFAVEVE
jgi:hypothetical protein